MIKDIFINDTISGTITLPDDVNSKVPLIIFFHGFGTNKDEVSDTFKLAAEK